MTDQRTSEEASPTREAKFLRELADECERSGTEFGKGRALGIREALDNFRSHGGGDEVLGAAFTAAMNAWQDQQPLAHATPSVQVREGGFDGGRWQLYLAPGLYHIAIFQTQAEAEAAAARLRAGGGRGK